MTGPYIFILLGKCYMAHVKLDGPGFITERLDIDIETAYRLREKTGSRLM